MLTSRYFTLNDIEMIVKAFFRFMDDGFSLWPSHLDINIFTQALNSLHPSIKFTVEHSKSELINNSPSTKFRKLNFLDITIILHSDGTIETD